MSDTPWTIVLGNTVGGSVVILPGPAGESGADGAQGIQGITGPVGPVAAPTAKYLLDTADAGLINGEVIHRGLGPDRIPSSPDAMDDEMTDPTTGYNPVLWTPFNAASEVYALDDLGGMRVDITDSDSVLRSIEQPLGSSPWDFTAKVTNAAPYPGATSNKEFIGISLRNSSTGRWDLLYQSRYSQANKLIRSKVNGDSSFISDTFTTWPDPTAFYYLRLKGDSTSMKFMVSTNGINFATIEETALYCGVADRIGIFNYCNEAVPWSGFVQWFRRNP